MKTLFFIILLSLITFSCQKEISPENGVTSLPTLTTTAVTSITSTTAASGGNISNDGGATVTARGVCWSTSPNPVVTGNHTTDGTGAGAFASNITGLAATTTYYIRAYATNSVGTAYGNEISFSTTNTTTALPTVTTAAITSITTITASGGGNVTADGGAAVTARGVCWSTTPGPVATGNHTTDGSGTGTFVSALTGLTAATIFYVRAYATNSVGTAYGNEISFTTSIVATLPTITTTAVTSITAATASSGGNISSDGGAAVTARGVCWSTTVNPTVTLSTKTTDGTGIGTFTSAITGLTAATTYHVRAYATNSVGTAYGADVIFNTIASIPADIYVAGGESAGTKRNAKYWKNGIPTVVGISDPDAYATDIFVSGTDVYVVGNEFFSNGVNYHWSAMLWKNGIPTTLAQTVTGGGYAEASSVFVSGSDVYVAGFVRNISGTGAVVKLWKNGVATDLTTGTTLAKGFDVFVSGTDVYVAGSEFNAAGKNIAKYWKNGIATSLSSVANHGEAQSIFVSGTDVYVSGNESAGGSIDYATLWINGIATTLSNGPFSSYANDVIVSGTDVYVVGQEFTASSSSSSVAKTWKNGVATILPSTTPAWATAIGLKGSDVYITGQEWNGTLYVAKLWTNNVASSLTNGTNSASANGIFVK